MKRKGSANNGNVTSGQGKAKKSKEKVTKPPPSPAAKVLISRALRRGKSVSPKPKITSTLQMDVTSDSSMMSNADSTLNMSNLRKILDKTDWWKDIDKSMLNIPIADLTTERNNGSTLDEDSVVMSPEEKKKRKARRVSKSAFVQAIEAETPESPSKASGKNVSPRSSVSSNKTDEDPPSPKEQRKPHSTRRQNRRISFNTFNKEMNTTRQSSRVSVHEASSKSPETSDNAEEDPPSPQEQQKPYVTRRQTRRISFNTFNKEMNTTRLSSRVSVHEASSKSSETSDNADEDPPSPQVDMQSRPTKRQARRYSFSTFQREMGPNPEANSPEKKSRTSEPIAEDLDSPLIDKSMAAQKIRRAMTKVEARVFEEALQDASEQDSPQLSPEIVSSEASDDESLKEALLDTSSKKKNRTNKSVSFETFIDELKQTTPSPTKQNFVSLSSSESDSDSFTQSTSLSKQNAKSYHKKVSLDGFRKILGSVTELDSPRPGPVSADEDNDSDTMSPLIVEKKRQIKKTSVGTFENMLNETSRSSKSVARFSSILEDEALTEETTQQENETHSKQKEFKRRSVASFTASRHSMATILEGEMLDDVHESEKRTNLRSKKISLNTFTAAMNATGDSEDVSNWAQQSEQPGLDVSKTAKEKLKVSRDSLSAFARKGPVRHSASPYSPQKSNLSRIKSNLSHTEHSAIASPSKNNYRTPPSKTAANSPNSKNQHISFSSPEKSFNSSRYSAVSMDEVSSPEFNTNKAKQPQSRVSAGTFMSVMDTVSPAVSPEKQSPQNIIRKSTSRSKASPTSEPQSIPLINSSQSNQNSYVSPSKQSPNLSKNEANNSKTPANMSDVLNKKLSILLKKIDFGMEIQPEEINSEKNESSYAKKSVNTSEVGNNMSWVSSELEDVNTSSRFKPAHFTAADFHNALNLLEQENERRLQYSKEDSEEEEKEEEEEEEEEDEEGEQQQRPKLQSKKKKFSLTDFQRAMESIDIDASIAALHEVASDTASSEPVKPSPRKSLADQRTSLRNRKDTDVLPASPRKIHEGTVHEETEMPITSLRKSLRLSAHEIAGINELNTPARSSPRKAQTIDSSRTEISISSSTLPVTKDTNEFIINKIPPRFSLPIKGSNVTRKSALRKRYTLIDFQRAMETVRSPSFTSDSPSTRTRRSSLSKFSIYDFERAISTLKADDISGSNDSSFASNRNSISKLLSSLSESTSKITAINSNNTNTEEKILQFKQPNSDTSKLSLHSGKSVSPSKHQDADTSKLSLRSGKSVSPSKHQDAATSKLSLHSGKSVSPSKHQDADTSKLSLRSGKSVSPSKHQDADTSKLSLHSGKSVSPSKHQDADTSKLSLHSGKSVSPSKHQDADSSKLSLRSGKSESPSKHQDADSSKLSLRSGKSVSPSKHQDADSSKLSLRSGKSVSPSKHQDADSSKLSLRSGKSVSPSKHQDADISKLSLPSGKSVSPSKQQNLNFSQHPESQSINSSVSEASELSMLEDKTTSKRKTTKIFTLEDFQNAMATAGSPTKSLTSKNNSSLDTSVTSSSSNKTVRQTIKSVGLLDFQQALLDARSPSITEAASVVQARQGKNDASTSKKVGNRSAADSLFQEVEDEIEEEIDTAENINNDNDMEVQIAENNSMETNRQSKQNANISTVSTVTTPGARKSIRSWLLSTNKLDITSTTSSKSLNASKLTIVSNKDQVEDMETLNIDSSSKHSSQLTDNACQSDEEVESDAESDAENTEEEQETPPPESSSSESEEELLDLNKSSSDSVHTEKAPESDDDNQHFESNFSGVLSVESSINQSMDQEKESGVCRNLSNAFSKNTSPKLPTNQDVKIFQDALKNAAISVKYSEKNYNISKAGGKKLKKSINMPFMEKKQPPKRVPVERILNGKIYRKPRLKRPKSWVNDRLYKHLENHFSKQNALKSRLMSEEFVLELVERVTSTINSKAKVLESATKVARLVKKAGLVEDNYDFFCFCQDYLPEAFVFKAFPYNDGKGVTYLD